MQLTFRCCRNILARIESESNLFKVNLTTENERLRKRLDIYEQLESDIDESIVFMGQDSSKKPTDLPIESDQVTPYQLIAQLARNPERRIQQSVTLARKLASVESKRRETESKLVAAENQIATLQKSLDSYKHDFENIEQPKSYLIIKLREEESSKIHWMKKHQQLSEEFANLRNDNELYATEISQLRLRLTTLLQQRSEVDALRELLEAWQHVQEDEAEDVSALEVPDIIDEAVQTSLPIEPLSNHFHDDKISDSITSFAELGLSPRVVSKMLSHPALTSK